MERLTYRGTPQMTEDGLVTPSYSDYSSRRIIEKLAEYEDLEEQGLILKLPCKVGDTVYSIHSVPSSGKKIISEDIVNVFYLSLSMFEKRFGNTVFFTLEEAEQKLKELEC